MNNPLLEQLPDIHLPAPISWWPPAPGWWIIATLVLAIIIYLILKLRRRRLDNAYRHEAIHQLEQLQQGYRQHRQSQRYLQDLVVLLRRLLKTAYPDQHWESLPASTMLNQIKEVNTNLIQIDTTAIESYLYKNQSPKTDDYAQQFHQFLHAWIQQHRRVN